MGAVAGEGLHRHDGDGGSISGVEGVGLEDFGGDRLVRDGNSALFGHVACAQLFKELRLCAAWHVPVLLAQPRLHRGPRSVA